MCTCGLPNWIEEQVTDNNYSDTEQKHLEKSASAGKESEALAACDEHKEGSSCMSQESLIATVRSEERFGAFKEALLHQSLEQWEAG